MTGCSTSQRVRACLKEELPLIASVRLEQPMEQSSLDEVAAARVIAGTLRDQAARMPTLSQYRALALRSAARWDRLAGSRPRLHLAAPAIDPATPHLSLESDLASPAP
jgi:hypothetical protein